MLYFRPGSGLSDAYRVLFPPLLSPTLWESRGNIPALTELFKAYIAKGISELSTGGHLPAILGVFQKLLSSTLTEEYAFQLLASLIAVLDTVAISPFLGTIFNLIFTKLMSTKSKKYPKLVCVFLMNFAHTYGGAALFQSLESMQVGMTTMIITQVFEKHLGLLMGSGRDNIAFLMCGGTRLLLETPLGQQPGPVLSSLVVSLTKLGMQYSGVGASATQLDALNAEALAAQLLEEQQGADRQFDSAYSKLVYASVPSPTGSAELENPPPYFVRSFAQLAASNQPTFMAILHGMETNLQQWFHGVCHSNGIAL